MIKLDKKTNTWLVSYSKRHPVTKVPYNLRRKSIKTKTEAKKVFNDLVLKVEDKINRKFMPTWKGLVEEYIKDLPNRNVSLKTVESYHLGLKAHTFEEWGSRLVDSILPIEIRTLVTSKVGHRSQSHQKNVLKYIRNAFIFGIEAGYIDRNPTPAMKFRIGDKLKGVLTEVEVKKLLTQARDMNSIWYPIWVTALYTGMRSGELYALTWDKVDLEGRKIKVDTSWNKMDGFKCTKSGNDRILEIAPNLLIILKELKLRSTETNFVLPRIDKWDQGEQARELRIFLEGLGLPRIRFHDLRATWATIMLSKGVEPIKVMMMGGWSDLKTLQIYVRKAGVNVSGITDKLSLHDPVSQEAKIFELK